MQLMKKAGSRIVFAAVGVAWLGWAGPLSATVIFDNTVHDLNLRFNPGTLQVGDEITLASTGNLNYFSFEYWGEASGPSFAGSVQVDVKFYLNDGAPFHGYNTPGTVLYDTGFFAINPTPRSTFVYTPGDGLPIGGLNLPSTDLTWTVQFSGMAAGDTVGVDLYSPPQVGSEVGDFGDYWQYNGGWTLLTNSVGPIDIGAYMVATVPEPSSMTLSLLGGVGMLMAMRWFRRKE
jgi:hypothetical protein